MRTSVPDPSIRLAIRSDRRLFHDALAMCLGERTDCTVVGHVTHGPDLFDLCRLRRPDIVLFDAGTDISTSTDLLTELTDTHPDIHLIVTYESLTRAGIALAARLGIDTLVPHSHGLDALVATLHRNAEALRSHAPERSAEAGLTAQEREIITLLSAGHTADRVAELLDLSQSTVENCKRRIYQKMRVTNQSHAIARAAALGVVSRPAADNTERRPTDRDARTRVLVLGPDTSTRHHIAVILVRARIPFVVNSRSNGDGPAVAVAVDSVPAERDAADLPVLLIRSRPMSRAAALSALAGGVVGIIAADNLDRDLVPAVTLTASGHLTISASLVDGLMARIQAQGGDPDAPLPQLTQREHEILHSIAAGHTVRQTARTLGIAQKTVENIQARLFRKLGVRNRSGAAAAAHSLGLLDADAPDRWRYIWFKS